ncbi:heterokaryon incompatibility protein-domain-containing protein [Fusarium oxysporum]|nr:heterokaryon incompatibility protein-domain-containing protein [Fusarium oxysporum]
MLTEGLIQVSVRLKLFIGDTILVLTPKMEQEGKTFLSSAGTICKPVESSEIELLGDIKSRHIKAFDGGNIQQELAELIEYQIQPWMESCRERHIGHELCGAKYVSSGLPTRLLDVGETNDHLVKLVEVKSCTNLRDVEYLILSYCWGNGNGNSKTTETNLGMRLRGFAISDLSKTIQDAILLTRLMGFQYLWVDAICIIQGPTGDFRSESPRMGDYYSNAVCCISASVAKDSQEGFLTKRPLARFPIDDIAIKIANHHTAGAGYTTFKAIDDDPGCGHFSPREIMSRPDEEITFDGGWYQLISVFSKTQLTYETDRLYAIHGLASILIQRLGAEYFNGLFRPSLAQGLLWYHDSNRREAYKRPKDSQLPSWCWASACPISYQDIQEAPIYVKDDHPERPLQFPTHSEALSVIESTASRLYIRAPLFQLTIGRSDVGYIKKDCSGHTESFRCRYFLDVNRQVLQSMPQSPSVGGEWGQGVDVLWFPVGRDHTAYPYVPGLLVYEVPDEGKVVYRRYGLLQCSDSSLDEKDFEEVREIILV